jgi:hypothetical protein
MMISEVRGLNCIGILDFGLSCRTFIGVVEAREQGMVFACFSKL